MKKHRRLTILCLLSGCILIGCGRTGYEDFQDEDPDVRVEAIRKAAERKDAEAIAHLVERLEDSESQVRFFAFVALKRITGGRTMGWHYANPVEKRKAAVVRWRKWLKAGQPRDWPDSAERGEGPAK